MNKNSSFTHRGNKIINEDFIFINEELGLYIVADGVSTLGNGHIASKMACNYIEQEVINGSSLKQAIYFSHKKIIQYSNDFLKQYMATTIAAVMLNKYDFDICWVGCSRVYNWNNNKLTLLTKDDSLAEFINMTGINNPNYCNLNTKKILTQAVGNNDRDILVHSRIVNLDSSNNILLTTDGFHKFFKGKDMNILLKKNHGIEKKNELLKSMVDIDNAKDDMSYIIIETKKMIKGRV